MKDFNSFSYQQVCEDTDLGGIYAQQGQNDYRQLFDETHADRLALGRDFLHRSF